MAFAWIKIEDTTPDKPEVWAMAERLGIDADAVVGKLVRIWIWADQQTVNGNARSVTKALLDRCAGVTGFADAMMEAGWLVAADGGVSFVNFDRHNGETAKKRAQTARRVQRHRAQGDTPAGDAAERNAASVTDSVTKALPEKRREEGKERENGPQGQPFIPEKMNTPECLKAFEDWCDYLDAAGLDSINPRYNGPQAEAVWKQAHRFGPEKWPLCVQFSIANAYKSIVEPSGPVTKNRAVSKSAQPDTDPDFLRAVAVCKEFPSGSDFDREKRESTLGPELIRIVRKMTSARLAESDRFTQKQLAAEWAIVREGMK